MADDMMELDDTPELDGDDFIIATADQNLVDSSPGHYPLRNGRTIVKPAARDHFQKPWLDIKAKVPGHGVRKKKRSRKHATTVSERKRQRQVRDAIANGSYLIEADPHSADPSSMVQDQPEHLQRLTKEIVLQALTEHTPGLTFPALHNSPDPFNPLSGVEMHELEDLTQALEVYQIALARQGKAILSAEAGILVKTFVRDVLKIFKRTREQLGNSLDRNVVWFALAQSFQNKWSLKWMRGIIWKRLKEKHGTGDRKEFRKAFNEAMENPGRHPELDEEIAYTGQLRRPYYGHALTLRSLVHHFVHARARYLHGINSPGGAAPYGHGGTYLANSSGGSIPSRVPGILQRQLDIDSSDEEYDGPMDSGSEEEVEDNIQVEGELLVGRDRSLIKALDRWMELSEQGKKQDNVDMDMLSALDLG